MKLSEDGRTIVDKNGMPVMGLVVSRMSSNTLEMILTLEGVHEVAGEMYDFLHRNRFEIDDYFFEIGKLLKKAEENLIKK